MSITYTCNLCGESIDRDSPRLDSIPTAVDESIAEARSKHRRDDLPEQEDECPGDEDGREDEGEPQS